MIIKKAGKFSTENQFHKNEYMLTFAPVPQDIEQEYVQLVEKIDSLVENLITSNPDVKIKCGPGCDECCIAFSVLPLEAALLADKLAQLPHLNYRVPAEGKCCLLLERNCLLYDSRPIICRTQGLPLGYIDEERGVIEVSACPVNFSPEYPFKQEELLYMDELNTTLANLNNRYCEQSGCPPLERVPIRELLV